MKKIYSLLFSLSIIISHESLVGHGRELNKDEKDVLLLKNVYGMQAYSDGNHMWLFVSLKTLRVYHRSIFMYKPTPVDKELFLFRYDGKDSVQTTKISPFDPYFSFHPLTCTFVPFKSKVYFLFHNYDTKSRKKISVIYQLKDKELLGLSEIERKNLTEYFGLDLNNDFEFNQARVLKRLEKSGWERLEDSYRGTMDFQWKGQDYRIADMFSTDQITLRLSSPSQKEFKPIDLLSCKYKKEISTKEYQDLLKEIKNRKQPETGRTGK